jgi:hypothetical protein
MISRLVSPLTSRTLIPATGAFSVLIFIVYVFVEVLGLSVVEPVFPAFAFFASSTPQGDEDSERNHCNNSDKKIFDGVHDVLSSV